MYLDCRTSHHFACKLQIVIPKVKAESSFNSNVSGDLLVVSNNKVVSGKSIQGVVWELPSVPSQHPYIHIPSTPHNLLGTNKLPRNLSSNKSCCNHHTSGKYLLFLMQRCIASSDSSTDWAWTSILIFSCSNLRFYHFSSSRSFA